MTEFPDDLIPGALAAYDDELRAWVVEPDTGSQFNDRGVIRYKAYWVHDSNRTLDLRHGPGAIPPDTSFQRIRLSADFAKVYPRMAAMKAALRWIVATYKELPDGLDPRDWLPGYLNSEGN